ncbi:hypothetical protein QEN19_000380 [Hanseniaspora menglaensis]
MAKANNSSNKTATNVNGAVATEDLNYSFTAWSPLDTVKDIADQLGLKDISNDVLKTLAMDVEYRILEVIENANKFKKFSKRSKLTYDDINKSMEVLNLEPLYGYGHYNNKSGQVTGSEILSKFKKVDANDEQPQAKGNSNTNSVKSRFYIDDEEVDFDKLINEPLPEAPRIPTHSAHWLAVEGVQPNIAQNPNIREDIRLKYSPLVRGSIVTSINENTLIVTNDEKIIPENDGNQKDEEDDEDNDHPNVGKDNNIGTIKNTKALNSNVKTDGKDVEIKLRVKHVISKELQIYFEKITTSLLNPSPKLTEFEKESVKQAALQSLSADKGIHQLLPYFIAFINEQITYSLDDLNKLTTLLEMVFSILVNKDFFLEPYYNSLIPCILTLLLAKNIGTTSSLIANSNESAEKFQDDNDIQAKTKNDLLEQSLAIRNFSSQILSHILSNDELNKSDMIGKTIKPKIVRTILKTFLDKNRSMGTYYGCFKIMIILGSKNTEIIRWFLGNLNNWCEVVLPLKEDNKTILSQFADNEVLILLDLIIEFLEVLKRDLPELAVEKMVNPLEDSEIKKLAEILGQSILNHVLKLDTQRQRLIYEGIFFGSI